MSELARAEARLGGVTLVQRVRARRREDTIGRLRAALAVHPPVGATGVILFGSLARGDFDGASDADLLVIGGDGSIDARVSHAADRACDVIAVTAEAYARAVAAGHPFYAAVAREGVELWRAPGGGDAVRGGAVPARDRPGGR